MATAKKVRINIRNLSGLIRKTSFNNSGMFISYQFIAVAIGSNGKPYFYQSRQASSNSWTNYPGAKIWNNKNQAVCRKQNVLSDAKENLERALEELVNYGEIEDYEIID